MNDATILTGTLRDGGVVLDEKPDLPPGRVRVTVQPVGDPMRTEVWQVLEKIRAGQRARGHVARTVEEVEAEREAAGAEDEERLASLERIHREADQARNKAAEAP